MASGLVPFLPHRTCIHHKTIPILFRKLVQNTSVHRIVCNLIASRISAQPCLSVIPFIYFYCNCRAINNIGMENNFLTWIRFIPCCLRISLPITLQINGIKSNPIIAAASMRKVLFRAHPSSVKFKRMERMVSGTAMVIVTVFNDLKIILYTTFVYKFANFSFSCPDSSCPSFSKFPIFG